MIVSICGSCGSGKSSIAKKIAETFGWKYYSMGGIRRETAEKRGLTLAEYNKLGETDPTTDYEVDEYQKRLGETSDNFVVEGRTSWYLIPHSLKVYLEVSDEEGARRIFSDLKNEARKNEIRDSETYEDVLKGVKERKVSDNKRYLQYYGISVFDFKNYDCVIDTTNLSFDEVFDQVYKKIKEFEQK